MTTWRRRLALRIDPTLAGPLATARERFTIGWNERIWERHARDLQRGLRQAATILRKEFPTVVGAWGDNGATIPAHEHFTRLADTDPRLVQDGGRP